MHHLVRRYIARKQQANLTGGVTEDDLNEIKQDIASFRYELVEILRSNGLSIPNGSQPGGLTSSKTSKQKRQAYRRRKFLSAIH